MSTTWLVVLIVGAFTIAFKAAGPVLLGGRELPRRLTEPSSSSHRHCSRHSSSHRPSAASRRSSSTGAWSASEPRSSRYVCGRR